MTPSRPRLLLRFSGFRQLASLAFLLGCLTVVPSVVTGATTANSLGAGATFADVVRLRFFVTDWTPDKYDAFVAGLGSVVDELGIPQPLPPLSAIGVDYLFEPDVLVEVEAYAVLD